VTVSISPTTAGQTSTYTVGFTATSLLAAGSGTVTFNANGGESGTVFPSVASDYVVTDSTHSAGSGTVTATPSLANGNAQVTFAVPASVSAGDSVSVAISGVTSPPLASSNQTIAVSTSADTAAVTSPTYFLTASADGSGLATVNPVGVVPASATSLTFTYTAAPGGTYGGQVNIVAPTGWTAPSTNSATAGYTTASTGAVSVSGQTITVSGLNLASGQAVTVVYGSGGGNSVAGPITGAQTLFAVTEKSTAAGTVTPVAGGGVSLQATVNAAPGQVTTIAGSGANGTADGVGRTATFQGPAGAAVIGANVYVTDTTSLRQINTSTAQVTTITGGGTGCGNGNGTNGAGVQFQSSRGLATDGTNIFSLCGSYLRSTNVSTGATSTVTNLAGYTSYNGLTYGADGAVYTAAGGRVLRTNTANGQTTTWAPSSSLVISGTSPYDVYGITSDASSVWVAAFYNSSPQQWVVWQIPYGASPTPTRLASYSSEVGDYSLVSAGGYLYADGTTSSSTADDMVLRIDKTTGAYTLAAGSGSPGSQDGVALDGWFGAVRGLASDGTELWAADLSDRQVKEITSVASTG
jgi:hypothetical protein